MNELIPINLIKYTKFQLFQLQSTNGVESLEYDNDMHSIIEYLNNKEFKYVNNKIGFQTAKRINEDFFNLNLPLQDVYCLYKDYNIVCLTTPFDINVHEVDGFPPLGKVYSDISEDMIFFEEIILDTNLKSNLVSFYAHELVHTQIEKNIYRLLDNYFDREFLSIFIELVISNFCNEEYNHNAFEKRLEIIKRDLSNYKLDKKKNILRCYIVSSFKAFHLYNYYVNSNSQIKKEILNDIERIFKEEITVGTLLNKYEIDYDNSRKIKYLKR